MNEMLPHRSRASTQVRSQKSNTTPPQHRAAIGAAGVSAPAAAGGAAGVDRAVLGKDRDTPPSALKTRYRSHRPLIRQSMAQRLVGAYWAAKGVNLRGSSVVGCGRWRAFTADGPPEDTAVMKVTGDRSTMEGHFVCGCNWTCETCASTTVARNRGWMRGALFPALEARSLSASLVTLNLAHTYGAPWELAVDSVKAAFGLMDRRMAKAYRKAGSVGKFKAFEVTIGLNGIHPHLHVLVTHRDNADLAALEVSMRDAWFKAVEEVGGRCTDRGFDFQANRLTDYAAKMGAAHELASQSTKQGRRKGRTLSQSLDAASRGDLTAGAEWQRAIAAIGSTNRFHTGALAKNLEIPTPAEWAELPDDGQGEAEEKEIRIQYPLRDHLTVTSPTLGRPGMALIRRAAARNGESGARRMIEALCADSDRQRMKAWLAASVPWEKEPDIVRAARSRPLTPDEVPMYLFAKRDRFDQLVSA